MPVEERDPGSRRTQQVAKGREIGLILEPPVSVQKLQTALQAKAKESPGYRFYLLYDKLYRKDVLEYSYRCCKANKGAPGVDEQEFADIVAYGEQRWLGELADTLRRKTYRAEAVRRVWIPKEGDKTKLRPLGVTAHFGPCGHDGGGGGDATHLRSRHACGAARLQAEPQCPHGGTCGTPPDQYGTHASYRG